MKKFFLLLSFCFSISSFSQSKDETVIRKLLSDQTLAWNNGDVENFMRGYWKNDSLMFIGQSGVTYGWTNTLNSG